MKRTLGLAALALVALPLRPRLAAAQHGAVAAGDERIPGALRAEHAELQAELASATKLRGPVGEAARRLAALMEPHFVREQQIALPELGLLVPLSRNDIEPDMADVVPLADSLRAELPQMLREHERIAAAARALRDAAARAHMPRYVRFADGLLHHAQMEEQVMYPAALLVGQVVKRQLAER